MSFYKLISRADDAIREKDKKTGQDKITVKPRYTSPQPGLLPPDHRYYWHVRAMDERGVWGPWSKTWGFVARGQVHPLNVTLDYDADGVAGILRWKGNSAGRAPVKFRGYGSDEKGFTIADQRFHSTVGVTKEEMASWNPWFPANFIAETTATELAVIGREIEFPSANKTYYRVVAVTVRATIDCKVRKLDDKALV